MMIKTYEEFNLKNLFRKNKKNNLHSDIDPYGEEDWEYDNLSPILQLAKEKYPSKTFEQITILNCTSQNLTNLDGIEKLINLNMLDCSDNQLTNLNGIENLRNLEYLYCYNNQLTSLNGIENLRNLKELYCYHNQLTNLDGIMKLKKMEILWFYANNFSNDYNTYLCNYCNKKNIDYIILRDIYFAK